MPIDVFLSGPQKRAFSSWTPQTHGTPLNEVLLGGVYDWIASLVPRSVAPNVLTLSGLLCGAHALYLTHLHLDTAPLLTTALACALLMAYQTLDGIDGRHARAIRNASPLGELFDHACANVAGVFVALTLASLLGVSDTGTLWYATHATLFAYLLWHLRGLTTGSLTWPLFSLTGPGEALWALISVVAAKAVLGDHVLAQAYETVLEKAAFPLLEMATRTLEANRGLAALLLPVPVEEAHDVAFKILMDPGKTAQIAMFGAYLVMAAIVAITVVFALPREMAATRNGILLCLVFSGVVPTVHAALNSSLLLDASDIPLRAIILDGTMFAVLITDLVVAKMASRDLHPWVVIFFMIGSFNHFLAGLVSALYFALLFWEVSVATNLPMFTTVINVFVDGVYDMFHSGHMKHLRRALALGGGTGPDGPFPGTRLIVGVCSDEDMTTIKRRPILSMDERVEAIRASGLAHEVIPASPAHGLSEEFILKHNIHVVCHSVEYDHDADPYYRVPREMGIARALPRTEGISTSDLIRRIRARTDL